MQPSNTVAGVAITPTVAVLDAFANPVTSAGIAVDVTLGANPGSTSLGGTLEVTTVSGVAAFTDLHIDKAATGYSLQATAPGLTAAVSTNFSILPGSATRCVFSGQPSDVLAGAALSPAVRVDAMDAFDNPATSYAGNVTLTLATNPAGGTLVGTMTISAVGGSAVFTNLNVNKAAGGYTLAAACSGLAGAASAPFTVAAGPASRLLFTTEPTTTGASSPIAPPVQVTALDALDNIAASFTGSVTMAIATNPTGGVLSGATTVSAGAGVATFPDLRVDKVGVGYTLTAAAAAVTPATSVAFDITTAPTTTLAFTTQPANTTAGSTIAPAITVTAQDGLGNTVTSFTGNVTIAIGTNPSSGTLSGTLTIAAVGGVATFTNLSINKTGTSYRLLATAASLASASSAPFNITAGAVSASTSTVAAGPASITASNGASASIITVTAKDALGNLITGATVALAASGSGNSLVQPAAPTSANGVATGSLSATTAGSKIVSATINGVAINQTASVTVNPAGATVLVFTGQPTNTVAAAAISGGAGGVVVTARDAFRNTATGFTAGVTMAIGTNPSGGTLSGTLARSAVSGVATFSNLSIDKIGSAYVLVGTASSLPSASSAPFNITAGAVSASTSTVAAGPGSITASNGASASTITATAKDAVGNPVPGATVVLAASGSGNNLIQPVSSTNGSGVATGSLSATIVGSKTVSATINGVGITQTATVMVTPAAAAVLAFTGQPTNTATAAVINGSTGGVVVTARDAFGNTTTGFTAGVAMAIGTNPSGGTLSGTLTRSAVAGVATFGDLSINTNGTGYRLQATSGVLTAAQSATFNVTGASVAVAAGAGQTGLKGFALNVPPAVLVRDGSNAPLANVQVTFMVASGGGSVTGPVTTTDVNGVATVGSWTVQLGTNTLTATVTGSGITGNPVTFTANGVNGAYHIDVRFLTSMSPSRQAAFTNAAARWETLVYGDVPNISVNVPAGFCGPNSPHLQETVDDIVIYATVDSIDGPSNILGSAGPCGLRGSGNLPFVGAMIFDSADVAQLENDGLFGEVILHEMGHVLGYGTIWTDLNLLKSAGKTDSHFSGSQAVLAFDRTGGQNFSGGSKVPVENCVGFSPNVCGPGTQDSHWRELVFANELMTGFIDAGSNPLSVVTTASMGDLGYTVNYAASDPYGVANPLAALRARPGPLRELKNDILRLPMMEVDAAGHVIGVHPPR